MAKAILLVRVSTTKQEIETQTRELVEYAKADGFKEKDLIIIEGVGASAIKLNDVYMQEMEELYHTINTTDIVALYAWEISRIGRNEEILMRFKNHLIERGIQLVIKNPSLRLLNADGSVNKGVELAFSLFATMSKQEMEIKQSRFQRAKERNKAEGKYNGGKIKLGYCLDCNNYFVVDEEKAKVVRDIFQWYVDGQSLKKIFERLVEMGIYKSLLNFSTGGKRVGYLLKDTAYIGENNYPQIVDDETFQLAQEKMGNRNKWHSSKNLFFCKGLIKDTATNATLCARSATLVYYVRHRVHCISLNINAMDFIAEWSADYFLGWLNQMQAEQNTHEYDITIQENETQIKAKQRQIEDYTKAIERAIQMNIAQPKYFPTEKMEATINANDKQIKALEKQIVDLQTDNQRMRDWMNGNQQFINTIYDYSDEKKFEIIQDLIDRIEVTELEKHRFEVVVHSNSFIKRTTKWEYSSQGHKLKIVQLLPIKLDFTHKMNNKKRFTRVRYNGK